MNVVVAKCDAKKSSQSYRNIPMFDDTHDADTRYSHMNSASFILHSPVALTRAPLAWRHRGRPVRRSKRCSRCRICLPCSRCAPRRLMLPRATAVDAARFSRRAPALTPSRSLRRRRPLRLRKRRTAGAAKMPRKEKRRNEKRLVIVVRTVKACPSCRKPQ